MDKSRLNKSGASAAQDLSRVARAAGIRDAGLPSLESIARRRRELWFVLLLVIVGVFVVVAVISFWEELLPSQLREFVSLPVLRVLFLLTSVGFCFYVMEKERLLRRVRSALLDEHALNAALANKVAEFDDLSRIGHAINSELDAGSVLDTILASALSMLQVSEGAILVAQDDAHALRVETSRTASGGEIRFPHEILFGEGLAGRVARWRQPMLVSAANEPELFARLVRRGDCVTATMGVPLLHRNRLVGVLVTNSVDDDPVLNEYDLRMLGLLAESAALAVSNARLAEHDRRTSAELEELRREWSQRLMKASTIMDTASDVLCHTSDMDDAEIEIYSARLRSAAEEMALTERIATGRFELMTCDIDIGAQARSVVDERYPLNGGKRLVFAACETGVSVGSDQRVMRCLLAVAFDEALACSVGRAVTISVESDEAPEVHVRIVSPNRTNAVISPELAALALVAGANVERVELAESASSIVITMPILRRAHRRDSRRLEPRKRNSSRLDADPNPMSAHGALDRERAQN